MILRLKIYINHIDAEYLCVYLPVDRTETFVGVVHIYTRSSIMTRTTCAVIEYQILQEKIRYHLKYLTSEDNSYIALDY